MFIEIALQNLHKMHPYERPESANRIFYLLAKQDRGSFIANNFGVFFMSEFGMFFKVNADWLYSNNLTVNCEVTYGQTQVDFLMIYCNEIFMVSEKPALETIMRDWRNLHEICPEKATEVLQRILEEYPMAFSQTIVMNSGDTFHEYALSILATTCKFYSNVQHIPTGARRQRSNDFAQNQEEIVSQILFNLALELI